MSNPFSELFFARFLPLIERLEQLLPALNSDIDWSAPAFRWDKRRGIGYLQAIHRPHRVTLPDIIGVDPQKNRLDANTRQFVHGKPCNNVLLTGARGTGKSSLVKAVLNEYAPQGLRLIEIDKDALIDLSDMITLIEQRSERFILFCDDLSFEPGEPGYKAMKSLLDGSVAGMPDNLKIYATSNRRHLMPEYMAENLAAKHTEDGELRPSETTEEKVSLSERFGVWLSFYPFTQDEYLAVCTHWLKQLGIRTPLTPDSEIRKEALQWALGRGSRSGRVAWQFACDFAGREQVAP